MSPRSARVDPGDRRQVVVRRVGRNPFEPLDPEPGGADKLADLVHGVLAVVPVGVALADEDAVEVGRLVVDQVVQGDTSSRGSGWSGTGIRPASGPGSARPARTSGRT